MDATYTFVFQGSLDRFRALVEAFLVEYSFGLPLDKRGDDKLGIIIHPVDELSAPHREGWHVEVFAMIDGASTGILAGATIFAFRFEEGKTYVRAKDGQLFKAISKYDTVKPMGHELDHVVSFIEKQVSSYLTEDDEGAQSSEGASGTAVPPEWPRRQDKIQRWRGHYKKIKPYLGKGLTNTQISEFTGVRRQIIGHIIEWHEKSPDAHTGAA